VTDALGRIVLGQTVAVVISAMGSTPVVVPASEAAPSTLRWTVDGFMVFATVVGGRVASKGASPVEVVR